jgi:hypothetical protein
VAGSGVSGSSDLREVGRALKAAGDGGLRRELLAGIRKAGKPVVDDVKAGGLATIPSRGGLAKRVASGIGVRTSLGGRGAGVRIVRSSGIYRGAAWSLDTAGIVRHPVWGNRSAWAVTSAPGARGWFTEEIASRADTFRDGIEEVLADTANKIARSV